MSRVEGEERRAEAQRDAAPDLTRLSVAVAALNQTVGDWSGNRQRILSAWRAARARGARLLLCPELCVSGYSLGDRLPRRGTLEQSYDSLLKIAREVGSAPGARGLKP